MVTFQRQNIKEEWASYMDRIKYIKEFLSIKKEIISWNELNGGMRTSYEKK